MVIKDQLVRAGDNVDVEGVVKERRLETLDRPTSPISISSNEALPPRSSCRSDLSNGRLTFQT
jgi:hypothetical protein